VTFRSDTEGMCVRWVGCVILPSNDSTVPPRQGSVPNPTLYFIVVPDIEQVPFGSSEMDSREIFYE